MVKLSQSVLIDAAPADVWGVLERFGSIQDFNPLVKRSYVTSERQRGVGTCRHCDLVPMGSVEERVLTWQDGEGYELEIYDSRGLPPMKRQLAALWVSPDGDDGDRARVEMTVAYEPALGWLGRLLNAIALRRQFHKAIGLILAGLKHHVETGEVVDRRASKQLRLATA